MIRVSGTDLEHELAVRGWNQRELARKSGVSEATVSRAMASGTIRGMSAVRIALAFRQTPPVPELIHLVAGGLEGARALSGFAPPRVVEATSTA